MANKNPLERLLFQNQELIFRSKIYIHNPTDLSTEFHENMNYTKYDSGKTLFEYTCEYS